MKEEQQNSEHLCRTVAVCHNVILVTMHYIDNLMMIYFHVLYYYYCQHC